MPRSLYSLLTAFTASLTLAACADAPTRPSPPSATLATGAPAVRVLADDAEGDDDRDEGRGNGARTPPFNFTAVLHGASDAGGEERDDGSGVIHFRQPGDPPHVVFLDTRVHDLAPYTSYQLQRATDGTVDGICTGTNWLTLGNLAAPLVITTDGEGDGRALFARQLSAALVGTQFDIHFRVLDAATQAVVLTSRCHQFTVR